MSPARELVIVGLLFLICDVSARSYYVRRRKIPEDTLQLVHVLFRHGERTNDPASLYPKDPHINETYYPYGVGELNTEGKITEFNLGKSLRRRYDRFLGRLYTPDILEATSSGFNRTKSSLLLVLAGLFPPTEEQILETGLNWQPIPFNTFNSVFEDKLFYGKTCPSFKDYYEENLFSPRVQSELNKNLDVFTYLSENTGWNITDYDLAFYLYVGLKSEQENGLDLPDWTGLVFPEPLKTFAIKSYSLFTATTELRRLSVGFLLRKMIEDSMAKAIDTLSPKNRKIFLYSGHESNIAYMLQTLELFQPHIPPYGSHILFELHKIHGVYGFKFYYQDYTSNEPRLMKLPACSEFCPVDQFIELVGEYLPDEDDCGDEIDINSIPQVFQKFEDDDLPDLN